MQFNMTSNFIKKLSENLSRHFFKEDRALKDAACGAAVHWITESDTIE